MAIQERNSEMVNLLSVDFIQKNDTTYLAGIAAGAILMLPGLVAFWPMGISLSDDNTLYADALSVTGRMGEAWTALTLNTGGNWANYGGSYQTPAYKKIGDLVFLRGLVVRTSGTDVLIATLQVGYQPLADVVRSTSGDDAFARINIESDGEMRLHVGTAAVYLSLDGLWFSTL